MVHLVYCDNAGKAGARVLDNILAGTKTMVVRGAARRKIPHSRVFAGETLYFMEKGTAAIRARATVTAVENFVKPSEEEIDAMLSDNAAALALTEKQRERWHKKCLCLVAFDGVQPLSPALPFEKQNNMDDWLILDKIENVLVGTSIPYNYDNARF